MQMMNVDLEFWLPLFFYDTRWIKWCRCMRQWWPDTRLWLSAQQVEGNQLWSAHCVKLRPSQCHATAPLSFFWSLEDRSISAFLSDWDCRQRCSHSTPKPWVLWRFTAFWTLILGIGLMGSCPTSSEMSTSRLTNRRGGKNVHNYKHTVGSKTK